MSGNDTQRELTRTGTKKRSRTGSFYFYDLPVYRVEREAYYEAREAYVQNAMFPPGQNLSPLVRSRMDTPAIRDHHARSYGGCWEFNEIIGYIRLHFLGSQVRGDYFAVSRKRIVRTRTKILEWQTWKLAPEVDIESPFGTAEILAAIRQYIADCRLEVPNRYIDATMFEAIAPHVDWKNLR